MRLILFLLFFNSVSAFSQVIEFEADTLFMDGYVYNINNDDVRYELNLYDSTLLIVNDYYKKTEKISYKIENGFIYLDNIIFEILKDSRLKLIFLNNSKKEDFYFSGNYKINY